MTRTLTQAIRARGLNEKREVANLMRRLAYRANNGDRLKVFTSTTAQSPAAQPGNVIYTRNLIALQLATERGDTEAYVKAWTALNHLKA